MNRTQPISVCMATYNGARFVRDQIASILPQLQASDEIVVVDDCSSDNTIGIIESFGDSRIVLLRNERNLGVLSTFEKALRNARGEIIFLCDQDDVWELSKVQTLCDVFLGNRETTLALSDAFVIDDNGKVTSPSWFEHRRFVPGLISNVIKNRYLGCTMAFRKSILSFVLPFPPDIPMHDMWIGTLNQLFGKAAFVCEPLMSYRRHTANTTASGHASVSQMLSWRAALSKNLLLRSIEVKKRHLLMRKPLEVSS